MNAPGGQFVAAPPVQEEKLFGYHRTFAGLVWDADKQTQDRSSL